MSNPTITVNGWLSKDPESRQAGQKTVAVITVPQQRSKRNDQGGYDKVGGTTWLQAEFWEDDAYAVMNTLSKGSEVILTGQLATQEYTDREGNQRSKLMLEFPKVAVVVKGGRGQQAPASTQQLAQAPQEPWAAAPAAAPASDAWSTPSAGAGTYNDETPF